MSSSRKFLSVTAAFAVVLGIAGAAQAQFTEEAGDVLSMINEIRMGGATCSGTGTSWAATDPLIPTESLFHAAHGWSQAMLQAGQIGHGDAQGRIRQACPNAGNLAENVAGNADAAGAIQSWMSSTSGHCEAIMNPSFKFVGVGMARGGPYGGFWTIKFADNC